MERCHDYGDVIKSTKTIEKAFCYVLNQLKVEE